MQRPILMFFLLAVLSAGCRQATPAGAPDNPYASLVDWQKLTSLADPHLQPIFWKQTEDCYLGLLQDPSTARLVFSFHYRNPLTSGMNWSANFSDLSGRPLNWKQGPYLSLSVTRKTSWGFSSASSTSPYLIGAYFNEGASLPNLGKVSIRVSDQEAKTLAKIEVVRDAGRNTWTLRPVP